MPSSVDSIPCSPSNHITHRLSDIVIGVIIKMPSSVDSIPCTPSSHIKHRLSDSDIVIGVINECYLQ